MKFKGILLLLLIPGFFAQAFSQTFSDDMVRTFKVRNTTSIEVVNKYGTIHLIPWQKDSVKFEIHYEISTSSESKLKKLRSMIEFDFVSTEFYISAKTDFGKRSRNTIFAELFDMASYLIPTDKIMVNYKVYLPAKASIKLNNKFGDIYVDDLAGNINIDLSNGDLKASRLTGRTVININSGDASINYLEDADLIIRYSDFQIRNANQLNIDSKSSKIYIDNAVYLKAVSGRDKYYIRKTSELFGNSYFSDLNIDEITNEVSYSMEYGNLNMENIPEGFSYLNIESEYTDIDMVFAKEASFEIDITHNADVSLHYPSDFPKLEEKKVGEDNNQLLTYGRIGRNPEESKVTISATKKSFINIYRK